MTDTTPAAIAALLDGVTPGPWESSADNGPPPFNERPRVYSNPTKSNLGATLIAEVGNLTLDQDEWEANARFIAAARDLVPALASERDKLRAWADKNGADVDAAVAERTEELTAERDRLADELKAWAGFGIIEASVRNPNIAEYMRHWEGRAEKAEAENERLRAQLAAPVAVRVKPLVWDSLGENHWRAKTLFPFTIRAENYGGGFDVTWSAPGISDVFVPGRFASIEAAKAAAQADYAARIMAEIEAVPAATVRDAACRSSWAAPPDVPVTSPARAGIPNDRKKRNHAHA